MDVCRLIHEESPLRTGGGQPLFFSDAKARALVRNAIGTNETRANSWVGILGERGGVQGSVCLSIIEPSPFSHEQALDSTWNFVKLEYRRTTLAARTLQAFAEKVSDSLGIPLLVKSLGHSKGREHFMERVSKCQPFGGIFLYSSTGADSAAGA